MHSYVTGNKQLSKKWKHKKGHKKPHHTIQTFWLGYTKMEVILYALLPW